jgi:hypothetical protein
MKYEFIHILRYNLDYTLNKHLGSGKFHPITGHEGPEGEYRYSCTLSLTSGLDGVGDQRHATAALPRGKTRYPLYRRLGGPRSRSRQVRKSRRHRDSIHGTSSP